MISYRDFARDAQSVATQATDAGASGSALAVPESRVIAEAITDGWALKTVTDPFGQSRVYLHAVTIITGDRPQQQPSQPPPTMTPTMTAVSGAVAERSWSDDDDECVPAPSPPVLPPPTSTAHVEYFVTYSDAFGVPEIHFRGTLLDPANGPSRPLYAPEDWNRCFFRGAVDTDGLHVPAARPIVGAGICDALGGVACLSLHQCDTQGLLALCRQQHVQEPNAIRLVLRMLGPMVGMPPALLAPQP